MRGRPHIFAVFILLLSATVVSAVEDKTSVERILELHIQALGGRDKIEAVQSTVIRLEYREGDFVIPDAYMARMRPYYKTICDPHEKPGDICEGYDGSAWEWYADPGVVLRTVGAAAAAGRHGTELFDSLVDYETRGTRIQLSGSGEFDGGKVYRLHVTLADGFERDVFVDQQSFLITGDRRSAPIHAFGESVRSENHFEDYRPVEGVLFPFVVREVEIATGRELNRATSQSITINTKFSPSSFGPPQHTPTPLQQFLEQLYMERTDPVSVMYTYRDFRGANPDVDTREGVEFIGYQMAKMGDYNGAIELLKANATAYPKVASAQYGLGRAYKAAGQMEKARAAFQRALEIDPNYKKASDGLNALR